MSHALEELRMASFLHGLSEKSKASSHRYITGWALLRKVSLQGLVFIPSWLWAFASPSSFDMVLRELGHNWPPLPYLRTSPVSRPHQDLLRKAKRLAGAVKISTMNISLFINAYLIALALWVGPADDLGPTKLNAGAPFKNMDAYFPNTFPSLFVRRSPLVAYNIVSNVDFFLDTLNWIWQ